MSHLEGQKYVGSWFEVESPINGEHFFIPADDYDRRGHGEVTDEGVGILVRLSAPGYLDCTDWELCESDKAAEDWLDEMLGEED